MMRLPEQMNVTLWWELRRHDENMTGFSLGFAGAMSLLKLPAQCVDATESVAGSAEVKLGYLYEIYFPELTSTN
jgi:hypothetical protein